MPTTSETAPAEAPQPQPQPAAAPPPRARERRRVFAWEHPVLGCFEVHVDFDAGASVRLSLESKQLRLKAPTGVLIATPAELPDVSLTEVTLDLTTGGLAIVSEPALGAFGVKLLSGFIRDTLLAGFDAKAVLGRLKDAKNRISLYEGPAVKVHGCALSSMTLTLNRRGIELSLSEPIILDFGRLLGRTEVSTLSWSFSAARLDVRLSGHVNLWSRVVERVAPVLGRFYFRRFVPAAMLEPGFDLTRDKALGPHIAAVLQGLAGSAAQQSRQKPRAGPQPRIAVEAGDGLSLCREPGGVTLETEHGLFIDAADRPWLKDFRLLSVRWDAETNDFAIETTPPLGEAVRGGATVLLRRHVVGPLTEAIGGLPKDPKGRAIIPLDKDADLHLPNGTLKARLDGHGLTIDAAPRALVVARPRIARFALRTVRYDTTKAGVEAELSGASCVGKIFVKKARRILPAELGKALAELLPPEMQRAEYDIFADPDQAQNLARLLSPPPAEEAEVKGE